MIASTDTIELNTTPMGGRVATMFRMSETGHRVALSSLSISDVIIKGIWCYKIEGVTAPPIKSLGRSSTSCSSTCGTCSSCGCGSTTNIRYNFLPEVGSTSFRRTIS